MIEFITAFGCFFSKKTQILRTKVFIIRSFCNSSCRKNNIIWSNLSPWPVSFNNFSTSQALQIPSKIITKFVGSFGKCKPLASTRRFAKKCKNLRIRYGRGNVQSVKGLAGEMSGRGSLHWGSAQSGNFPVGDMSVGEMWVGDLSSGKCQ